MGSLARHCRKIPAICGGRPEVGSGGGSLCRWPLTTSSTVSPLERRAAGDAPVEDAAERVDVGGRERAASGQLLRRHARGRADHQTGPRVGVGGGLRDAEVQELDPVGHQHDVAGLQVAVDDADLVHGFQGTGQLRTRQPRVVLDQRPLLQPVLQVQPGQQLGDQHRLEVAVPVLPLDVVEDGGHPRMRQPRQRQRLPPQLLTAGRVRGGPAVQQLHGDQPVQARVLRLPDDRTAAGPQRPGQTVTLGYDGAGVGASMEVIIARQPDWTAGAGV